MPGQSAEKSILLSSEIASGQSLSKAGIARGPDFYYLAFSRIFN